MSEAWEYELLDLDLEREVFGGVDQEDVERAFHQRLNELGGAGWEAVGQIVVTTSLSVPDKGFLGPTLARSAAAGNEPPPSPKLLFKRPLAD